VLKLAEEFDPVAVAPEDMKRLDSSSGETNDVVAVFGQKNQR